MSYAIIRNQNHKMNVVFLVEHHNERLNQNYSNKDIDLSRTSENYNLKKIQTESYYQEFKKIREDHKLKGNIRLTGVKQSNAMCEFVITSDKEFFDKLGKDGTRRFFEDAYDFVKQKVGGEEYVVSAVVHNDESVPHCHIVYIPTVNGKDKKGNPCKRINCSAFWKGKNSYSKLQDEYYNFITSRGYNLERGEKGSAAEHLSVAEYKLKKTEEKLQKTSEKADEIKKNLAKENEYSVALRRKARSEYAVVTRTKEELEKAKKEADKIKREAQKIREESELRTRVAKLSASMAHQMSTLNEEINRKERSKFEADFLKMKSDFEAMVERFKEFVKAEVPKIKDSQSRASRIEEIEKELFSLNKESENFGEYVKRITQKNKQKERSL